MKRPGYIHGSFMDIRLLRATIGGNSTSEDASNLNLGAVFTRAFFDATLKNQIETWNRLMSNLPEGITVDSLGTLR